MKPPRFDPGSRPPSWMQDLGLKPAWRWLTDPRFGPASLVLLQPLVEGLLFRGLLQGGWWRAGVRLPSLLFGCFRDRHGSVYPAIASQIVYNAGLFLLLLI